VKEPDKGVSGTVPGTPLSFSKEVSVCAFALGSHPWSWDRKNSLRFAVRADSLSAKEQYHAHRKRKDGNEGELEEK
jgi:hypothetical protein